MTNNINENFLKKNSYLFGSLMGLVLSVLAAMLLKYIPYIAGNPKLLILCLVPNIILMRMYIKVWNLEKTGIGLLVITGVLMILFFIGVEKGWDTILLRY